MKKTKQYVIFTFILCSIVFFGSLYNINASEGRDFLDSSGDFKAVVNSNGENAVTIKFVPLKDNIGEGFCYIQKYINGNFAGSYPCKPNDPYYVNDVKKGDTFKFDFKYTLPNGYQAFSDSFEFEVGSIGGGDTPNPGDGTDPSCLTPPTEPAPYVEPTITVDDTPIHPSGEFYSDSKSGLTMIREGKVLRVDGWLWKGDFLAPFRQTRGYVKPSSVEGLLSNPHRADGLALNAGYYVPSHFTGHIPVFTEGNWWPNVGKYQAGPTIRNSDFQDDCGIYFVSGKPVNTKEPLLLKGFEGATVTNKTEYSILVTAGSFPGNEQPGQVMTPLNPNDTKSLPMPPKGWYTEGAVPELYASVAGIHPFDVVGWHKSRPKDFGTPGFAYVIDGRYDLGTRMMWFGFRKNEGYDPATSGDPGYGMAMYIDDELVAVTDMQLIGNGDTARQDLWAVSRFNPGICPQGGLMAGPAAREGQKVVYEFISHEEAQRLLSTKSGVLHTHVGSPQH